MFGLARSDRDLLVGDSGRLTPAEILLAFTGKATSEKQFHWILEHVRQQSGRQA
jgi:hypothetical protein